LKTSTIVKLLNVLTAVSLVAAMGATYTLAMTIIQTVPTLSITLPKELLYGMSANLQINLANIMFLFMIPSLLGIIKGIILALKKD